MKVALITDTHAGVRNDSELFAEYQKMFYDNVFFPELLNRGINTIFHGGDIFDRRKYVNFRSLELAKEMFFERLKEYSIHMHLITGNHDIYYRETNRLNSPDLLLQDYINEVTCYSDPDTVYFGSNNVPVHFIPWINRENYSHTKSYVESAEPSLCIGHLDIAGHEMHPGSVSEHGMSPDMFKDQKLVISGHFHTQSEKGNIKYIGNPFEFTWSDCGDKRGFWIIDLDTFEMEFIQNPYKMFHKIIYDDNFDQLSGKDFSFIKDKFVKLIVQSKKDAYKFDLFTEKLYKESPFDLQIVEIESELSTTMTEEELFASAKSTEEIMNSFIDGMEIESDVKTNVKTLFRQLTREANNE